MHKMFRFAFDLKTSTFNIQNKHIERLKRKKQNCSSDQRIVPITVPK